MKIIRTRYIENTNFRPEMVRCVAAAAVSLCQWVIGMDKYDRYDINYRCILYFMCRKLLRPLKESSKKYDEVNSSSKFDTLTSKVVKGSEDP